MNRSSSNEWDQLYCLSVPLTGYFGSQCKKKKHLVLDFNSLQVTWPDHMRPNGTEPKQISSVRPGPTSSLVLLGSGKNTEPNQLIYSPTGDCCLR